MKKARLSFVRVLLTLTIILQITSSLLVFNTNTAYAGELTADGNTLGLWHLNETAENSCSGGEDACDSSGNGYHMTSTATTISQDGAFNNARDFDAQTFTMLEEGDNILPFDTTTYSIEAWIKKEGPCVPYDCTIFAKGGSGNTGYVFGVDRDTDQLFLKINDGQQDEYSTGTITDGLWTHVAVTVTGNGVGNDEIKLYIGGTIDSTITQLQDHSLSVDEVHIGNGNDNDDLPWNGKIDEVRFSTVVRTPAEIATSASGYLPPTYGLYIASDWDDTIGILDKTNAADIVIDSLTGGGTVDKVLALALDPTTDILYGLLKYTDRVGPPNRTLVTIDRDTNIATPISTGPDFSTKFSYIAFDSSGQLYAIAGEGMGNSGSIYSLDKANPAAGSTLVYTDMEVYEEQGETMAYNPDNGFMYTLEGINSGEDPLYNLDKVDLDDDSVTPIPVTGTMKGYALGMTYDTDQNLFYVTTDFNRLYTLTTAGVATEVGITSGAYKSLAYIEQPSAPVSSGYITNLEAGSDVFLTSDWITDLEQGGNAQTGEIEIGIKDNDNGKRVAKFTIDFTGNRDFSNVVSDSDNRKSLFHVTGDFSNIDGYTAGSPTFELYIPKLASQNGVHICPGAETLAEVTLDCAGGIDKYLIDSDVSIVNISGSDYWQVSGLSSTGGLGIFDDAPTDFIATPAASAVSTTQEVVLSYTDAGGFISGDQIVFTFDSGAGLTLANTCGTPTIDADSDTTTDGALGIASNVATYTFTASTTQSDIAICVNVTAYSTAGNYNIELNDDNAQFGLIFYYAGDENDVSVTGLVNPTLSFVVRNSTDSGDQANVNGAAVGANLCDLGTLDVGSVSTCLYRLKVGTNALDGYSVNIEVDDDLNNAADSELIDNIVTDSTVTLGTEGYGLSFDSGQRTVDSISFTPIDDGVLGAGDFATIDSDPDDTTSGSGNDANIATGTDTTMYTSDGPNTPDTTDTVNTALVTHRAAIDSATPAGSYNQLITYTVTASF